MTYFYLNELFAKVHFFCDMMKLISSIQIKVVFLQSISQGNQQSVMPTLRLKT